MEKNLILSIFAAAVMTISATAFAMSFNDVPSDHWAYNAVAVLEKNDIISPYSDGSFCGDQIITRYEMAEWLANILRKNTGATTNGGHSFKDVPPDHWANKSLSLLEADGIISPYQDGTFRGDNGMNRYSMASWISKFILQHAKIVEPITVNVFIDVPSDHWARNAVMLLSANAIVEAYGDAKFRGDNGATRYEAAMMLAKTLIVTRR